MGLEYTDRSKDFNIIIGVIYKTIKDEKLRDRLINMMIELEEKEATVASVKKELQELSWDLNSNEIKSHLCETEETYGVHNWLIGFKGVMIDLISKL